MIATMFPFLEEKIIYSEPDCNYVPVFEEKNIYSKPRCSYVPVF